MDLGLGVPFFKVAPPKWICVSCVGCPLNPPQKKVPPPKRRAALVGFARKPYKKQQLSAGLPWGMLLKTQRLSHQRSRLGLVSS